MDDLRAGWKLFPLLQGRWRLQFDEGDGVNLGETFW